MEQRIGSSSQPPEGAGFDPAFVPGLTSPAPSESREAESEAADGPTGPRPEEGVEADAAVGAREARGATRGEGVDEEQAAVPEPGETAAPDGPVFEASDRRARIVADHSGIRLGLDDQACEFRWDEIGAVETETARWGKRFTVTVHTPERRWYPIEIEAGSRGLPRQWEAALDEVLDAYFEDGESEEESPADAADDGVSEGAGSDGDRSADSAPEGGSGDDRAGDDGDGAGPSSDR
ncbi:MULTISPECIES: hypothetical protein [unclassified Streptomyces]|uniref:hypothetical protein n=1 Tax=unclassified Streptomyces TaxID=2593676 RepID=UPI001F5B0D9A|nr:hypothetical protein [Streptomyces sp. HSG2]